MKNFNPDRAVMVDEGAEDGELEDFLANIDKKAKSFRSQIIGDAFRELAQSAKQERSKLLDAAVGKFSSEAAKERGAAVEALNKRMQAAQNKFEARIEKLLASHEKLEELVKGIVTGKGDPAPSKNIEDAVEAATKALREELADMEKQRKRDHADVTESLGTLDRLVQSGQSDDKPAKWRFTFGRDQFGRIDGEVIATRLK